MSKPVHGTAWVPGVRFRKPEGWHLANAVTYTSENGSALSVTERSTPLTASEDLATRLADASESLPGYALERARELTIEAAPGAAAEANATLAAAEAIFTWRAAGGPATERLVVLATAEKRVTALAFCFIGPKAEHASAQTTFAWIGGSVTR